MEGVQCLLTYLLTCLVYLVTPSGGSGAEVYEAAIHLMNPVTGRAYSHPPGSACPEHLVATMTVPEADIRLVLTHSYHYSYGDVPVYVGDGRGWAPHDTKHKTKNGHPCFYQDLDWNAGVSIVFKENTFRIRGVFHTNKKGYTIKPEESLSNGLHVIERKNIIDSHNRIDRAYSRSKRQAFKKSYSVETLAVIDFPIYKKWFSMTGGGQVPDRREAAIDMIKYYFTHTLHEVDLRYKSIEDSAFSMSIVISGIYIAETADALKWEEDLTESKPDSTQRAIDGAKLLDGLQIWVSRNSSFDKYDQVTLFTGYDMFQIGPPNYVKSYNKVGIAILRGACQTQNRFAAVEDKLDFNTALGTAHEMGHSLGAGHDGVGNVCDSADLFIMAAIVESRTSDNIYLFSPCSVSAFKTNIVRLNRHDQNCLSNTPVVYNQTAINRYMSVRPGTRFSVKQQCQLFFGDQSYFCGGQDNVPMICERMVCFDPSRQACYILGGHPAFPGTTCGNKMWCDKNKCVAHQDAPAARENCTFGDSATKVNYQNVKYTCTEIVDRSPSLCYQQSLRDHCCESCGKIYNSNYPDCPYGDRLTGCFFLHEAECRRDTNGDCCGSCRTYQTGIPGCPYGDSSSQCRGISSRDCYLPIGAGCCETCYRQYNTGIQDCEFGDKIEGCNRGLCSESYYVRNCCKTCPKPTTTPTTTTRTTTTTTVAITSTARTYTTPTTRSGRNEVIPTTTRQDIDDNQIGRSGGTISVSNLNMILMSFLVCLSMFRIRFVV